MLTACNGTYTRHTDGWRYPWGDPVPGAEDMTISNYYNLKTIGGYILVPASLAWNEPDLAWCKDAAIGDRDRLNRMRRNDRQIGADTLLVPVDMWDEHARIPIGMWAPELHPDALLTIDDVAALAGVAAASIVRYRQRGAVPEPQGHIGRSPWWTRPIIDHWLATRPGSGRPPNT